MSFVGNLDRLLRNLNSLSRATVDSTEAIERFPAPATPDSTISALRTVASAHDSRRLSTAIPAPATADFTSALRTVASAHDSRRLSTAIPAPATADFTSALRTVASAHDSRCLSTAIPAPATADSTSALERQYQLL